MQNRSILLVDDFKDGLDMYQEYLTYRGYQVIVARSGEEAISQARRHRPAVILLDIRMPVMTGTDAMRVLRADPSFQNVPIVALTAHALKDERVAALAAGFDELIPKPCLPDELVVAVERILAARAPLRVVDDHPDGERGQAEEGQQACIVTTAHDTPDVVRNSLTIQGL
jgi:CheY-like chemotaxis protein